jgi:mRNA interferase RelE/StbE
MGAYSIYFKVSVKKDLRVIPDRDLKKILLRVKSLAVQPRPPGCEKLIDSGQYRIRQGRYRIVYLIQDNELTVWIIKIGHRKDIYR